MLFTKNGTILSTELNCLEERYGMYAELISLPGYRKYRQYNPPPPGGGVSFISIMISAYYIRVYYIDPKT